MNDQNRKIKRAMVLVELDDGKIYEVWADQKHIMEAVQLVIKKRKNKSLPLHDEPVEGIEFEEIKNK